MLTFSFSVGSADDARTAAAVCDFLAQRVQVVVDPAELYAALAGAPVAESSPAQVDPPATPLEQARELIKQRGGLWFGNYMKSAGIDKKLSDYTPAELSAIVGAAANA